MCQVKDVYKRQILNFINSVLTNVVTRRKEFAMMEAIGMTKKQLLRMLILEGLYYAGITILAVLVFGSLFSFTVVRVLSGGIWFMKYRFVIWPMLAACPFLILFGIVVPYLAYAPQRKNSLVAVSYTHLCHKAGYGEESRRY